MSSSILSTIQQRNKLFLIGPFGSGKSHLALERIRWLLGQERVRGDDILVLAPQRTVGRPYWEALSRPDVPPGPPVQIATVAGLARNAVALYWPLLAQEAGFAQPSREPTFLTLETAQFHMARFVDAAIERGDFDAIRVERNRVISQILDNLNKAALHGFSLDEAYRRLALAVPQGEQRTARLNALKAAQAISQEFRALCLQESLVDFSLWIQLFNRHVLTNPWSRTHLFRSYRHLVMENSEEDTFTAHQLVKAWLPHLESALILQDEDAGFRVFLGADPAGVEELAQLCDQRLRLEERWVTSPSLQRLEQLVDRAIRGPRAPKAPLEADRPQEASGSSRDGDDGASLPLYFQPHRFYPQMIRWVVDEIQRLVEEEGVEPGQIAVLAPFVSDALRFSLQTGLTERGIPSASHRPSRPLRVEPAARALLTLAALAHPIWQLLPPPADVTAMLQVAIQELDPVRAHLLGRVAYGVRGERAGQLRSFAGLKPRVQQRITYRLGERYDRLREWLEAYRAEPTFTPLDQFFARIFGEVLSQPGYGFHDDPDAARIAKQLVHSARNFRWAVEGSLESRLASDLEAPGQEDGLATLGAEGAPQGMSPAHRVGRAYLELVESGALGALYLPSWQEDQSAVFIAPAYTFLMRNRPVDVQFWLDVGSTGWWERLYQPLTHPYVLSNRWPKEQAWSDLDEFQHRQSMLRRLVLGLVRRTRQRIYLGMSDYGESGLEQRGPLLTLINRVLVQEKRAPIPLP